MKHMKDWIYSSFLTTTFMNNALELCLKDFNENVRPAMVVIQLTAYFKNVYLRIKRGKDPIEMNYFLEV